MTLSERLSAPHSKTGGRPCQGPRIKALLSRLTPEERAQLGGFRAWLLTVDNQGRGTTPQDPTWIRRNPPPEVA